MLDRDRVSSSRTAGLEDPWVVSANA